MPLWTQMAHCSMDQIVLKAAYIKMKDPSDVTLRKEFITKLSAAINDSNVKVMDQYDL